MGLPMVSMETNGNVYFSIDMMKNALKISKLLPSKLARAGLCLSFFLGLAVIDELYLVQWLT